MSRLAHPEHPGWCLDAFDQGWTARAVAETCLVCGLPAYCVDPRGRRRHRVDCLELVGVHDQEAADR